MFFIFAPEKHFGVDYQSWDYLEYKYYPRHTPRFEEIAETELFQLCQQKYGTTKVKLIGYNYQQFNIDGWSFYPVQLVINSKLSGISWIKWQNIVPGEYFVLNHSYRRECDDYPINFMFCTDEENLMLSASYPQPYMKEIVCSNKVLKFVSDFFNTTMISFSFMYELQRQLALLLIELTNIKDIYKYIFINFFAAQEAVYENEFGYSYVIICPKSYNAGKKFYILAVKWRGADKVNVPTPMSIVGSDSITFELASAMPEEYKGVEIDVFADKNKILEIIQSSGKLKEVQTDTYFPVFLQNTNYPDMRFDIVFESSCSSNEIDMIYTMTNDFIKLYNEQNDNMIHDYNVIKKHDNEIVLYVDFGNADPEISYSFLITISKTIKNIKQVLIC